MNKNIETEFSKMVNLTKNELLVISGFFKTKHYKKGEEIGMFNLGSTVILLINKINGSWSENISNDKKILIRDEMLKKL